MLENFTEGKLKDSLSTAKRMRIFNIFLRLLNSVKVFCDIWEPNVAFFSCSIYGKPKRFSNIKTIIINNR